MMTSNKSKSVSASKGINVTGTIANLLEPIPVVGSIAGALKGLASSWLSSATNGLLNESGFEIGHKTSDRILAITAGVGAVSTQEAVSVRDGWAGDEPKPVLLPTTDKPTLPGPAAERLEFIAEGEWTEANQLYTNLFGVLNYPQVFYNDSFSNPTTTFAPNAVRHHLSSMNFTVVVTVNANPFTAGVLLVVAVPNFPNRGDYTTGSDQYTLPITQLTMYPHQFINLKTTNQATLILPYHGPSPLFDHNTTALYRLLGIVYSPLVNTQAQSGTSVRWVVQSAPMDVAFYGLHQPFRNIRFEGLPVRITPNVAAIVTTSPLDDVVVLAEGSQTRLETAYIPGRFTSFSQPLSIPTRMMNIAGTPGFTVNAKNNTPGSILYQFPVDLGSVMFAGTYLGELATCYAHWTGELVFSIMSASNQMTRGRIVVCFSPGMMEAPSTMQQAMLGTFQVYDIGLNSTFVFPIPFISRTQWRRTLGFQTGLVKSSTTGVTENTPTYDPLARAGVVTVWIYNSLQVSAPGSTTNVHFIPFISASSNFAFRLPQAPTKYVPAIPTVPSNPEENLDDHMVVRFEAPEPVVMMGANDAAAADSAPTQAPVDATPTVYSNLEDGQPVETLSKDVWEGMAGFTSHTSPDMLIDNFFGRLRLYKTLRMNRVALAGVDHNTYSDYAQVLLPLYWGPTPGNTLSTNLLEVFQSMAMYSSADVRVDLVFFPANGIVNGTNAADPSKPVIQRYPENPVMSGTVRVTNLPPGYKDLYPVEPSSTFFNKFSWSQLSTFPSVVSTLSGPATTVSVYIPFQSMYNALPSVFSGYRNLGNRVSSTTTPRFAPRGWGALPDSEFATLAVTLEAPIDYRCEVYLSFHNLQTFIPRPFITRPFPDGVTLGQAFSDNRNNGWTPQAPTTVSEESEECEPVESVNSETETNELPETGGTTTPEESRASVGRLLNKLTNLSVR